MSKAGLVVAKQYAGTLPRFPNVTQARTELFAERDLHLSGLPSLALASNEFRADYTPSSLKLLERWYFDLIDNHKFSVLNMEPSYFGRCVSFYFGEVLARHRGFEWIVEEYVFEKGRYEIGVKRANGSIMLTRPWVFTRTNNVRMQSLWRMFRMYAP